MLVYGNQKNTSAPIRIYNIFSSLKKKIIIFLQSQALKKSELYKLKFLHALSYLYWLSFDLIYKQFSNIVFFKTCSYVLSGYYFRYIIYNEYSNTHHVCTVKNVRRKYQIGGFKSNWAYLILNAIYLIVIPIYSFNINCVERIYGSRLINHRYSHSRDLSDQLFFFSIYLLCQNPPLVDSDKPERLIFILK